MKRSVIISALLSIAPLRFACAQQFTDVAAANGVGILVNSDVFGSGLSTYDFDEDGWDDLTFAVTNDSLVFYRNISGQLLRLPSFVKAPGETKHVLWVDYDNDGDLDISMTTRYGPYRLFQNDGAFHFTDVSTQVGFAEVTEETYGEAWADYDRDGDLDMYVCTYTNVGDESTYARLNHLYRNNGNGTFTDVTLAAGVGDGIKLSFQAVWLDYDHDGWPDLFVINDREYPNSFYRNNGDGTFSDVTAATGTAFTEDEPMSASVADFDNDGDLDIYTTNSGLLDKHGLLITNNGNGTFTDQSVASGVDVRKWTWGAVWADVDNDTWQDLYVAADHIGATIMNNVFYHAQGGAAFTEATSSFIGDTTVRSFGVARADLNNDGSYEIVVQNRTPSPPMLWMNAGGSNHWIKITLHGTVSNRMAIGSWIRVYAGGNRYTQYTLCGENYVGQNSQHHIFGLGQYTIVDSVQVEYLSGHTDTYYQLPIDQPYTLTEGDTYQASITALGSTTFCSGDSVILDAGEHAQYLWNDGSTDRYLTILASGEYSAIVQNAFGVQTTSDTVTVVVMPAPLVGYTTQGPLCAGEATGSIALMNLTGVSIQSVLWNTGAEGVTLAGLIAGTYTYLLSDSNGCTAEGELQLIEPPALFVQATASPVVVGNDGSIDVLVFGGVPPYVITINGSTVVSPITGLADGAYDLVVTDANGCTHEETVIVDGPMGLANVHRMAFRLFPNPVVDRLHFTCSEPLRSVLILDLQGRIILPSSYINDRWLDVRDLDAGHYVIHAITADGAAMRVPFIKL
ncbi:MAG: VCBS repeat-containing protein [Flavobacteriales bacterium]|nr:VCBS repeat-containing protein [Flavobacteriales bacterium]